MRGAAGWAGRWRPEALNDSAAVQRFCVRQQGIALPVPQLRASASSGAPPTCRGNAGHPCRARPSRHDFRKPGTGVPGTTFPPCAPGAAAARGAGARRSGVLRGEAGCVGPPVRGPFHLPSSRKVEAKAEPGGAEPSAAAPPHTARRPRPGRPRQPRGGRVQTSRPKSRDTRARHDLPKSRDTRARHDFPQKPGTGVPGTTFHTLRG